MYMASGGASGAIGASHRTLRELVCAEIRHLILSGQLAPGSRLVEDRLAAQLAVSRNPVREALHALAAEGLVEVFPRRGAVVAMLSSAEAEELFDVRTALEGLAASLAARRSNAAHAPLRAILDRARQATEAGRLDELAALNSAFHAAVVQLSGNAYLAMVTTPVLQRAEWMYRQSVEARAPHSWAEHLALLEAIAAGDERGAEATAVAHVAAARASFRSAQGPPRPI